jgi:hypothetical protein
MTASLTLKSLPKSLLDGLRAAADSAHRSLNKEVIHRLERSFDTPMKATMKTAATEWDKARVMEQVNAWKELSGTWESELSIEAEIEALYAARTEGRKVEL